MSLNSNPKILSMYILPALNNDIKNIIFFTWKRNNNKYNSIVVLVLQVSVH